MGAVGGDGWAKEVSALLRCLSADAGILGAFSFGNIDVSIRHFWDSANRLD